MSRRSCRRPAPDLLSGASGRACSLRQGLMKPRAREMGSRPVLCRAHHPGPLSHRGACPTDLVLCREQRSARSQPGAPPIFHQLQSAERVVCDFVTDYHRQLGSGQRRQMDRARGWRIRKGIRIGKLPFNGNISAYANVVRPDPGPDWTLRLQIALLPKSMF